MQLEKEIDRAVKRISSLDTQTSKSVNELEIIAEKVLADVDSKNYDFTRAETIVLRQNGKKRVVRQFIDAYSSENVLCHCIKQVLDKEFRIKYPNRNSISRSLFGLLSAVKKMSNFTIVKFDFKDYFNSLSTEYICTKYLRNNIFDRKIRKVVEDFCHQTQYAYAGFPTSNAMAEIVATQFDERVKRDFVQKGIIFFERYVDDSVLILNRHIEKDEITETLDIILREIFLDSKISGLNCRVSYNSQKFRYISQRCLSSTESVFDFLGYEFCLKKDNNAVEIKYGITQEKQEKYRKRLGELIERYQNENSPDYNNLELLRHRVAAFCSREVVIVKKWVGRLSESR